MPNQSYSQKIFRNFGVPIAAYRGYGKLSLTDGKELRCHFQVKQFTDGTILMVCRFLRKSGTHFSMDASIEGFVGTTVDGQKVSSKREFICRGMQSGPHSIWATFDLQELVVEYSADREQAIVCFGLTNLKIYPHPIFIARLEALNTSIIIKPVSGYSNVLDRLRALRNTEVTCELLISLPELGGLGKAQDLADDVCYLLSVAKGTKIQWIYYLTLDQRRDIVTRVHREHITKRYISLSLIDKTDELVRFVEQTYPTYQLRKSAYELDKGTIDTYLDAKADADYIQARGVKLAVAIEILKDVFTRVPDVNTSEFVVEKESFEEILPELLKVVGEVLRRTGIDEEKLQEICNDNKLMALNRVSFRRLIRKLGQAIGLNISSRDLSLFILSRNSLVHRGKFYCQTVEPYERGRYVPLDNVVDEYLFLLNFLDRVFLRLLGYRGPYIDWRKFGQPVRSEI